MKNNNSQLGGSTSKLAVMLFAICYLLFVVVPTTSSAATVKSVGKSGLVGYWSMDEGTGTKVNDMSGNKNPGATSGSVTWGAGRLNKSLGVTGGSYLGIQSSSPTIIQGDFTISVWIKTSTTGAGGTGNYRDIISKVKTISPWPGYVVAINNTGAISVWTASNVSGAWSDDSGYNLADSRWHLVNITLSGTSAQIYVDGVAKGSFTKAIPGSDNNGVLSFGAEVGTGASRNFSGNIDDVRIYSRALSSSEIKTLYQFGTAQTKSVQKSGLIGYWPMNEGAGSKVNDMSGNRNSGILSNTSWVSGKFSNALSFNGSSSYVDAGSRINTSNITEMTISAWVYNNAAAANKAIAGWWNGTNGIFIQSETTATDGLVFVAGGGSSFGTVNYTTVNRWTHVVLVYDGSLTGDSNRLKGYVDGVQKTLSFAGGVVPASISTSGNLMIGNANTLTRYWNGKIDETKIYNRALSETEVQQLYKQNATQVNSSKNDFLTNGLVGLWSFDGRDINWGSNTAYDRSGQGNDGTLTGMSTSSSPINGKLGQALNFSNGSPGTSFVRNNSFSIGGNPNFTVSGWFKRTGSMNQKGAWGIGAGSVGLQTISSWNNVGEKIGIDLWGTATFYVNYDYPLNSWVHVVWVKNSSTFSAATVNIYVNGVSQTILTSRGTTHTPSLTSGVTIGGISPNDSIYNGPMIIDDFRIYNRILSATEVKQLYNMAR